MTTKIEAKSREQTCSYCPEKFTPGVGGAAKGACGRCYSALRRGKVPTPFPMKRHGEALARVTAFVGHEQAMQLAKRAKREKVSRSAIVAEAITAYLRERAT